MCSGPIANHSATWSSLTSPTQPKLPTQFGAWEVLMKLPKRITTEGAFYSFTFLWKIHCKYSYNNPVLLHIFLCRPLQLPWRSLLLLQGEPVSSGPAGEEVEAGKFGILTCQEIPYYCSIWSLGNEFWLYWFLSSISLQVNCKFAKMNVSRLKPQE